MRVAVIGAGYVGLVQSAGLTHLGHVVRLSEADVVRLEQIRSGALPIYEPGLLELFNRARGNDLLSFHSDNHEAVAGADVIFLALPHPALTAMAGPICRSSKPAFGIWLRP